MRRLVCASVAAILAAPVLVLGAGAPSGAIDQGSMGEVSPDNTHVTDDYPPIPGVYPVRSGAHPFAGFRPFGCASYNYCNRHTLDIQFPDGYLEDFRGTDIVGFGIRIALSWENYPDNDVDLFIWPDDDPTSGAPQGPCSNPRAVGCNPCDTRPEDQQEDCVEPFPEVFNVVDPLKEEDDPETTDVDESQEPITVFISVVNDTGVNQGYTLEAQWFLIPFGSFDAFEPPEIETSFQPPVTQAATPAPFDPGADERRQEQEQAKILVPGEDGELVEQSLGALAAGQRITATRSGTASWVWVTAAVISGVAVGLFAFFVYRRRRAEALR